MSFHSGNELSLLAGSQQGQVADRTLRRAFQRGEGGQEIAHLSEQTVGRDPVATPGIEGDAQREGRAGGQAQRVAGALHGAHVAHLDSRLRPPQGTIHGIALEGDEALEQRQAPRRLAPALHGDQRDVLVLAYRHLPLLESQEPRKGRLAGTKVDAEGQGVDEQPHDPLDAGEVVGGPRP